MRVFPSAIDTEALASECAKQQFWRDSSGIEMSHAQFKGLPPWVAKFPTIGAAIAEIEDHTGSEAVYLMVNRLAPGVTVHEHTDADNGTQRWHLPVVTNADAWWWDERNGHVYMDTGVWFNTPYTIRHQVGNGGDSARIHLIVDVTTTEK